jgi:hypothetical protein
MKTSDVTDTLDLALQASGCDQADVEHKPSYLTTGPATSLANSLNGWVIKKWGTSGGRHTIHKLRVRLSGGIKP